MTTAAPGDVDQPRTVRVLAVRVEGEQLHLLGEAPQPTAGASAVPLSGLVLRERESGDEVRVDLTTDGPDAPLSALIDVRPLLRDGDVTWDLRVEDAAGRASGLEWGAGSAPAPGVVLRHGEDLLRARVRD